MSRAIVPWLAAATIERFAGQLRDEVEPEAVERLMVAVASKSVRPASASLWIRGGSRS